MAQRPEPNVTGGPGGGGGRGRRGGGGGGSGPTLASAGLNFDTSGLESFTAALKKAAEAAEAMWKPFTKDQDRRKTLDFLNKVKQEVKVIRGNTEAIGARGLGLGGGGGGAPGGAPGRTRVGGNFRMPQQPGALTTDGAGVVGLAWNARELARQTKVNKVGGDYEIAPIPRTGMVATAGLAASVIGSKLSQAAANNLPMDVAAQTATARAMLTGGAGQPWSGNLIDQRTRALQMNAQGFFGREDVTAAQMLGRGIGVTAGAGGAAGQQGRAWMNSVGALSKATGISGAEMAQTQVGLQSAQGVTKLLQYGINVSPQGRARPPAEIFRDMLQPIFGTDRPSLAAVQAARLPGTNRALEDIFAANPAGMDHFLSWVEANIATGGTPITTEEQARRSPIAEHTALGQEQATVGQQGRRQAGEAKGRLDVYEGLLRGIEKANEEITKLYEKLPWLGDAVGRVQGAFDALNKVMGPFTTYISALIAGHAIKAAAGGALGAGGAAGGLAGGAIGALGAAAGVGTAAAAGVAIGTGIRAIPVGGGNNLGGWASDRLSGAVGAFMDTGERSPIGGGRKQTHKGKQIYKGKTQYGVDMKEGGPTEYYDYGKGPFSELLPEGMNPVQGDPIPGGAAWQWQTTGVGDPEAAPAAAGVERGTGWGGLNADFRNKLRQMFQENPRLNLTSGFRTYAEQARLYDRWMRRVPGQAPAAAPGKSKHEKGYAADIGPRSEYGWLAANAPKYGLTKPMSYEPWHWEPTGAPAGGGGGAPAGGSGSAPAAETPDGGGGGGGGGATTGGGISWSPNLGISGGLFGGGGGGGAAMPTTSGTSALGSEPAATGSGTAATGGGSTAGAASIEEALRLAKAAGFSGDLLKTMVAIAIAESNLRKDAKGDTNLENATWGPSVGMWQVRTLKAQKGKGTTRDEEALLADPAKQAQSAMEIYKSQGLKAWSVWTKGTYSKNMSAVQQIMTEKGIGDPIGQYAGAPIPPPTLTSSGMSLGARGGSGGPAVSIGNLTLKIEIARGTPEEAERAGLQIVDILADRDRLMAVGDDE